MRNVFPGIVLALLLLPSFAFAEAMAGAPAPVLTATRFDGKVFDLAALRGHVVVVHFWATWCPGCREEMPLLDALYKSHRSQDLQVIAVSVDRPHDRDEAKRIMSHYSFPSIMMNEAENGFGSPPALPVTYIIDRDGVMQAMLRPDSQPLTGQDFENAVATPLSETGRAAE